MTEGQSVTVYSNHVVFVFSRLALAMVEQVAPLHTHTPADPIQLINNRRPIRYFVSDRDRSENYINIIQRSQMCAKTLLGQLEKKSTCY